MRTAAERFEAIVNTMRRTGAILRDAEVSFALGGSVATWARGGPETCNDVDFIVSPSDAERAQHALTAAGLRTERPPEGWLLKAWDGDVLIDLVLETASDDPVDEQIARAEQVRVASVHLPVVRLEDVMVTKLWSFDEHTLDFAALLQIARALREQIDWQAVRDRTHASPYAKAFFVLVEELGIAPAAEEASVDGVR